MAIVLPGELRSQTAGTGIGDIQQMYSTASGTWIAQDLTDTYGGVPAVASSAVSAFALSSGDNERVFYLDTNRHVQEMYSTASGTWVAQDLTAVYSGVPAGAGNALSAFALSSGDNERVFYLDANGHVQQMYSTASGTWVAQDLTAGYGGVAAASGSALSAFALSTGDNERIFYLDANGHVQQMYSTASGTWEHQGLTAGYSGVPAAAGSALSAFALSSGDNERIFYLDANGHVQQMYSTANGTWVHQDLMAGSSGSALSAFALSTGDYERVFYLDTNGHVQEIYSTASGSWVHQDLTAGYDCVPTSIRSAISAFALSSGDYERVFFLQGYTLSGHVLAGDSGLSGATVTLTGATAAGTSVSLSTTTDSNGNYSFTVPAGGNYTVTPSLAGYIFSPTSQASNSMNANQTVSFTAAGSEDSTPDPSPAAYPDDVASPPSAPAGSCSVTGTWADAASGATWSIVQTGNAITGSGTGVPPSQYGCASITWQVSGTIAGNTANLNATNPSPAIQSCSSGVQWTASNPLTANVAFSNCIAGTANETASYPAGSQFASGGSGPTILSGTGSWTLTSNPLTFTISSPAQISVPGLSNAQMVPMAVIDSPALNTTTASLSNYSFTVNYSAANLGNTDSNCQATLSIPNGGNAASSDISASSSPCSDGNNDGSGIFTVSGSIGQSNTTNSLYVIVPPLILARELYGEAHGQIAAGDTVSELAVGSTIRNEFGDNVYFKWFNNWQNMTSAHFNGLSACGTTCLTGINHSTEVTNAAFLFAGVNTAATNVDESKCFFSPSSTDWQTISTALKSGTTVFPSPISVPLTCWSNANRQLVYKASVPTNATCKSCAGAPAFIFEQYRVSSAPAVIQIP